MTKRLHKNKGEMELGKKKTSITIDEDLWKNFNFVVLQNEGNNKLSDVLEKLIKQYIKKNGGMQK
jgi:metal-responsive CopG/Arc/MetJ family transcriptional regulator